MKAMLKRLLLILLLFASGCSFNSGRIQLLNYDVATTLFGNVPSYVTIAKGDTLYSISRRYDIPLRDLITANHLSPPYNLAVGQVIRIPQAKYHIVAKGDTLYNISKRYNVDVTSLSKLNNIQPPYALAIGQKLALPGSVSSAQIENVSSPAPAPKPKESRFSFWKKAPSSNTTVKKTTTKTVSRPVSSAKPATVKPRKSKFAWPVKGTVISKFGTIGKGRTNDGINIRAARGNTVRSADKGTVVYAGNELKGFGNLILIKHTDGWVTAYAHNQKLLVKKGQKVVKGEKIATVGDTGGVNEPQLHFEVRAGKKPVNPLAYLP